MLSFEFFSKFLKINIKKKQKEKCTKIFFLLEQS